MRTTVELPEELICDAMKITKIKTKTDVLEAALINLVQKEKIRNIKKYQGKVELDVNLDHLRKR
ncbi:MAG: type II toxin-antitoxin system VapB family antitoxin [Spirochaetota bacterium]